MKVLGATTLAQRASLWPTLLVVASVLAVGSLIRIARCRRIESSLRRERLGSLAVWWGLLGILAAIAWLGEPALGTFLLVLATLAWRELGPWVVKGTPCPQATWWVGAALWTSQFVVVVAGPSGWADAWLPVAGLIVLPWWLVLCGQTRGFLRAVGGTYWAVMLVGYGLTSCLRLAELPERVQGRHGAIGWFLFVFLLTQTSDIVQALVGRRWGRRAIAPAVSPRKTWEGFFAGMTACAILGVLLGAPLTPMDDPGFFQAAGGRETSALFLAAVGLGLGIAGFLGDLTLSAVKRDIGVKDSGRWLPSQGGILDRIDSFLAAGTVCYWGLRLFAGV